MSDRIQSRDDIQLNGDLHSVNLECDPFPTSQKPKFMKARHLFSIVGLTAIQFVGTAQAVDVIKANNTTALNAVGAWNAGAGPVPGAADVGVWNNVLTASNAAGSNTITALGGDLSWQGVRVANVAGTANTSTATSGIQITNGSSANTLTLGTAGIDMSAATQALLIQSKIALSGNQSWNVTNANTNANPFGTTGGVINAGLGEDLVFAAQVSSTPMNLGGFTLGTSGTGAIAVTNGYAISNGTLNFANSNTWLQSGSSRLTSLASNLTVTVASNSNLRLRANSGGVNSAAPISVSGTGSKLQMEINNGTASMIQSGNLTLGNGSTLEHLVNQTGAFTVSSPSISTSGTITWLVNGSNAGPAAGVAVSGSLGGNGTIAYRNTATGANGQVRLSGNNSGFTGSITLDGSSGNRNLRLTAASAGSSSAIWSVSTGNILEVDGVSVSLGTLNGAGSVTNSHATNAAGLSVGAGSFSGILSNGAGSGGLALTKTGIGTLSLTGANTYTGATNVNGGTLSLTTAQTGAGAATVADTATLSITQLLDGNTFNASSVTLGTSTGGTLSLTPSASPTVALLTTPNFTVNGTSVIRVTGTPVSGTTLVDYTGSIGGAGFAGLSVALPFRVSGTLQDDTVNTAVNLINVEGDTLKWQGNLSGTWDIDTTNGGVLGTANWKTSALPGGARYVQAGAGLVDSPVFDDSATGSTSITLNSTVSPVAITFSNSSLAYSISGSGSIAGTTSVVKGGSAALTLATANTFSGGVQLNEGTLGINHSSAIGTGPLTIEDSTVLDNTSGAAVTLSTNNPQSWNGDFTFTGSNSLNLGSGVAALSSNRIVTVSGSTLSVGGISGSGRSLTKEGAGTLEVGASTYSGSTVVNGGTLKANSTTSFSSSSSVTLADAAGVVLDLSGFNQTINFLTGGGSSGGNLVLGTSTLTTGTVASATLGGTITGTGALIKNSSGTLTLSGNNSGFTGTTTVNGGVLAVGDLVNNSLGSGNLSLNNGSILQARGTFTRTVGTGNGIASGNGGFAAVGGNLTVNFGGASAAINLSSGGNVFGGGLVFGSPFADSKVIIQNPIGVNNFNSTRPVVVNSGAGGDSAELAGVISGGPAGGQSALRKSGSGRLIYSAANTFSGDTRVDGGTLEIANDLALQNSAIDTTGVGVFDFTPVTTPTIGGLKGGVNLASAITSGYSGITALTLNTFNAAPLTPYSYSGVIANGAAGMSLTKSGAGTQVLSGVNTYTGDTIITSGTLSLTNACLADGADVRVSAVGTLNLDYAGTDTVDEFYLNGVQQFSGTWGAIGSGATHQTARITGTGILNVVTGSADAYGSWALSKGLDDSDAAHSSARSADPDGDGVNNLAEFAFDGDPLSAASDGKIVGKIATVGGDQVLTLTLPVRTGATFSGATEQVSGLVDTIIYRVQGSADLGTFGNVISEVTGGDAAAIQSGLPGLSSGWSYRSFRTAGTVSTVSKDFMRARVTE